jgi:hypothetical protein
MLTLRSPKTPVPVGAVGKLEPGLVLLQAQMISNQAAVVNNSLALIKQ